MIGVCADLCKDISEHERELVGAVIGFISQFIELSQDHFSKIQVCMYDQAADYLLDLIDAH